MASNVIPFPMHAVIPAAANDDDMPPPLLPTRLSRAAIEAEVDRLIGLLDLLDGDCDLEDGDPVGGDVEDEAQEWFVSAHIPTGLMVHDMERLAA